MVGKFEDFDITIKYTEIGDLPLASPWDPAFTEGGASYEDYVADVCRGFRRAKHEDTIIPCRNPYCKGGGYYMSYHIGELLREGKLEMSDSERCVGTVNNIPGKRCFNHIKFTIKASPKKKTEADR